MNPDERTRSCFFFLQRLGAMELVAAIVLFVVYGLYRLSQR